jgi:NitT/TauT family transport system ATP-binding protein
MTNSETRSDSTRVTVRDLEKRFSQTVVALHGINLDVEEGEFVSLVGPSGCGKSTLLRLVAGLEEASAGSVARPGVDEEPGSVGFVFQDAHLLPWRTVRRNIELLLEIQNVSKEERRRRANEAIALVGLQGFADAYPRQLSGGMKMRVSLARTLVLDPQLFLLDEPFGALDEITREKLNDDLVELTRASGLTTLFVTHSVTEAVYLSHRVVVISERPGSIVDEIIVPFPERHRSLRSTPEFVKVCADVTETLYRGMESLEAAAR